MFISPQISTFEENYFFRSLCKNVFLPICEKISTFRKRRFFQDIFLNICTFRGKYCFLEIILKNSFCPYLRKYQHLRKSTFYISLKKCSFDSILRKITFLTCQHLVGFTNLKKLLCWRFCFQSKKYKSEKKNNLKNSFHLQFYNFTYAPHWKTLMNILDY